MGRKKLIGIILGATGAATAAAVAVSLTFILGDKPAGPIQPERDPVRQTVAADDAAPTDPDAEATDAGESEMTEPVSGGNQPGKATTRPKNTAAPTQPAGQPQATQPPTVPEQPGNPSNPGNPGDPANSWFTALKPGTLNRLTNPTGSDKRFTINGLWSWYGDGHTTTGFKRYIDTMVKRGFNAVTYDIQWADVEAVKGSFEFAMYDERLDYAVSKGLSIFLRVGTRSAPAWVPDSYYMRDYAGNLINFPDGTMGGTVLLNTISYANRDAVAAVAKYWNEVVRHYQGRYPAGTIQSYQTLFDPTAEFEYNIHGAQTDYSPAANAAFRRFLKVTYADIDLLNKRWGTSHASFDAVPIPHYDNETNRAVLNDYMTYRKEAQQYMSDTLADVVHQYSGAKYGIVLGSVWDSMIRTRGTMYADFFMDKADWLHTADAPGYDFSFSMSVSRGIAKNKKFTNEIDGKIQVGATNERYDRQWQQTFAAGASAVFVANWSNGDFGDTGNGWHFLRNIVGATRTAPQVKQVATKKAIYTSTATLVADASVQWQKTQALWTELSSAGADLVDIIRDGTFIYDHGALEQYSDIYIDYNTQISDEARAALVRFQKSGGKLHVLSEALAGSQDAYGRQRVPLGSAVTDDIAPRIAVGTKAGSSLTAGDCVVGIADDASSGVAYVEYSLDEGRTWAKARGCTNWSVGLTGLTGTQTVRIRACDNNNNVSAVSQVAVTVQ